MGNSNDTFEYYDQEMYHLNIETNTISKLSDQTSTAYGSLIIPYNGLPQKSIHRWKLKITKLGSGHRCTIGIDNASSYSLCNAIKYGYPFIEGPTLSEGDVINIELDLYQGIMRLIVFVFDVSADNPSKKKMQKEYRIKSSERGYYVALQIESRDDAITLLSHKEEILSTTDQIGWNNNVEKEDENRLILTSNKANKINTKQIDEVKAEENAIHQTVMPSPAPSPAPSPPRFKCHDIVMYQGQEAEIMRVFNENEIEITYPVSLYIMQRQKKTVSPQQLQKKAAISNEYNDKIPPRDSQPVSYHHNNNNDNPSSYCSNNMHENNNKAPITDNEDKQNNHNTNHHHNNNPSYLHQNSNNMDVINDSLPSIIEENEDCLDIRFNEALDIPSYHNNNNNNNNDNDNASSYSLESSNNMNTDSNKAPSRSTTALSSFKWYMSAQDAFKLCVGDKIDHRDGTGRFIYATIIDKHGTNLQIHYNGWSKKWDIWSDFTKEIHQFARALSISRRPAHRFGNLQKGDYVDINPTQRHQGWKCGEILQFDDQSGQIQVIYQYTDKINYLHWAHLDNPEEIAEFKSKQEECFKYYDKNTYLCHHGNHGHDIDKFFKYDRMGYVASNDGVTITKVRGAGTVYGFNSIACNCHLNAATTHEWRVKILKMNNKVQNLIGIHMSDDKVLKDYSNCKMRDRIYYGFGSFGKKFKGKKTTDFGMEYGDGDIVSISLDLGAGTVGFGVNQSSIKHAYNIKPVKSGYCLAVSLCTRGDSVKILSYHTSHHDKENKINSSKKQVADLNKTQAITQNDQYQHDEHSKLQLQQLKEQNKSLSQLLNDALTKSKQLDDKLHELETDKIKQQETTAKIEREMNVLQNDLDKTHSINNRLQCEVDELNGIPNKLLNTLNLQQLNTLEAKLQNGISNIQQARVRWIDRTYSCIVCMENAKNIVTNGCNHLVLCDECEAKLESKLCPICQKPYSTATKITF